MKRPSRIRAKDTSREGSIPLRTVRLVASFDILVAVGVFLLAALAPDAGLTITSLRQGFVLATVFAAAPIAALARSTGPMTVVALGGGMTVAGTATTVGGNPFGLVIACCGLLLVLAGGFTQPTLTAGMIGRLLLYAIILSVAMWLALGTMTLSGVASLILAVVVATSTRWKSPSGLESPAG